MSSATAVLVCALNVLGRSASSMPPIELLDAPPPGVSSRAEAFIRNGGQTIYLITSSVAFREAAETKACGTPGLPAMKKLASVLVHEEWHIRYGSDERGAYEAQLITLLRLGLATDSAVVTGVRRSMIDVLNAQKRAQRSMLLATLE